MPIIENESSYRDEEAPEIGEDEINWTPTGPEENKLARLLAHIRIAGTSMHLEAHEVFEDESGLQTAVVWGEDFDQIAAGIGVDGAWHTTEIGGRRYVLIAAPYCC